MTVKTVTQFYKSIFTFCFLLFTSIAFGQSYPDIPGSPTTFQNTNTPDPFGGTFYNGGNAVYTVPGNMAMCVDRATPVCDGTKDPLSPGAVNTNTQLAYAMYLVYLQPFVTSGGYSDDVKRELFWELSGQTSTCTGNATCNTLLQTVRQIPTSGTLTLNITMDKSQYKVGEKVIFTVTTNVAKFRLFGETEISQGQFIANGFSGGGGGAANDRLLSFCDASGNPASGPSGAFVQNDLITYPITGDTPVTYYVCSSVTNSGTYPTSTFASYSTVPSASSVTSWERAGCQPLIFMMPPSYTTIPFTIIQCPGNATLTSIPATCTGSTPNNDGKMVLVNFTNDEKYVDIYGSGSINYGGFSSSIVIPADGIVKSDVPNVSNVYAYRIYNETQSCYYDIAESSPNVSCSGTGCITPTNLAITPRNASINLGGTLEMGLVGNGLTASTVYDWTASGGSFANNTVNPAVWTKGVTAGTYDFTVTASNGTCTATATSSLTLIMGSTGGTGANICLQKTVSNPNPVKGGNIVYTTKISNAGPQIATNVVLKDLLPAGLTFVSVNTGTYDPITGLWTIGTVPVGTTAVSMIVTVD